MNVSLGAILKQYGSCVVCAAGFIFGMVAVHLMAFNMAIHDASQHLTRQEALWQTLMHDTLVGVPVGSLCGLGVALILKQLRERGKTPQDQQTPQ